MEFKLRRRPISYVVLMIVPPFLLNFLAIIGMFMFDEDEPASGMLEKVRFDKILKTFVDNSRSDDINVDGADPHLSG